MQNINKKISIGARSLTYPNPVLVIGTYDLDGIANIMTASWAGICNSEPPCIAISLRKARKTYENVIKTGFFTVNIPSVNHVKETDYVGIYSGHKYNKFPETQLTPVKSELINAPIVAEFPVNLECEVIHSIELGSHVQFIGKILDIKVDEQLELIKGIPSVRSVQPFVYDNATRAYYAVGELLADAYKVGK